MRAERAEFQIPRSGKMANIVSQNQECRRSLPNANAVSKNPKKCERSEPKSKIISYFSGLVEWKKKKLIINLL